MKVLDKNGMSQAGSSRESICICGSTCSAESFSKNFVVFRCKTCQSERFGPADEERHTLFDYNAKNDKYDEERYLQGSDLRWAHRQLSGLDWTGMKVLEMGCYNGFFVRHLCDLGANAYGFDLNRKAVSMGRDGFQLTGRLFEEESDLVSAGPFDALILIDVLEHMPDPGEFLRGAGRLLKKKGLLFIAGPTVERGFFDKSDFPPHHNWRFSRMGLNKMLGTYDFRVEKTIVERDGVLLLRNFLGRLFNGFHKKEFYGDVKVNPPDYNIPGGRHVYSAAQMVTYYFMRVLGLSYCSTLLVARKSE